MMKAPSSGAPKADIVQGVSSGDALSLANICIMLEQVSGISTPQGVGQSYGLKLPF